jgi:radical SAM superfamily enzyme YgiQ (UPF0313 family)
MLIVSLPVLDLQYPPSSPAIIKACVKSAGYQAKTADLNILLLELCKSREKFDQVQYNFENVGPQEINTQDPVLAFFDNNHDLIRSWVDASIDLIIKHDPVWLGISVFSYKSHKAALLLCAEIKRRNLDVKIVLGGRGASSYALGPDHRQFRQRIEKFFGPYPNKNFANTLLAYGLATAVIHGDGEQAVIDLLQGNTESDISGDINQINLETLPFVDFDDYDLEAYNYVNQLTIPITGSKGCVRQCTFCDIPVLWPKFKFRSGEHIAQEMIHLFNRHGVKKFYMTDSLVNGSLKAFDDFITRLAEHNTQNPDNAIKWVGQYITRARSKSLDDRYYDLIKASGGEGLTIGVESGSDAVRAHMKKQFTTADIDHELQEFDRRGIVCVLLFFSCYPTETWQDFLDTVDMFIRYQKYCATGTVYKMTLGTPYTHHAQTPLWNMQEEIGLSAQLGSDILWSLKSNSSLTYYERIRRRLILQEVATALKLPMSRNTAELTQLADSIRFHQPSIDKYFDNTPIELYDDYYNLTGHAQVLMPPDVYDRVKRQIIQHYNLGQQILDKHQNINDDIKFDNHSYIDLRNLLLKVTNNEVTTR